ncbi:MAG TPA: diaminopimelate decarboxylase [Thermodesulfobacteriota bacterium]|nr:diaminopimelate decarboxylase [Deltaproteobacteria bacterium]HNR13847.1 diaminopimelate decarboxylase [Thermodesulfobacteriota bacterium]HNU71598.1 diaminopimelate decarboxylase [Thermodesulfobacteriota bacterium]HOC37968.1 diaminopimelate decarboxylase [Thermodesulfobacteriota bacterium]
MHYFHYQNKALYCEEVPVAMLAEQWGTPLYVYSHRTLCRHFQAFDRAFSGSSHIVCFSVKANSNGAILRLFQQQGGGADVVSGGELFRALRAGISPKKIVYSGVGKKREEIDAALEAGILMFNIESSQELQALEEAAAAKNTRAPIAFRINPDIDPKTHPYISTGLKMNKFGIDMDSSLEEYRRARELKHIDIVGIDCHIGSQITSTEPFVEAIRKIMDLIARLRELGICIQYLDLGGGLGITYSRETPPHPDDYAQALLKEIRDEGLTLILEPGRVIVGNAGILITRVLYTKSSSTKNFVIVDAGMNDLIRPSLYHAHQEIVPVVQAERETYCADVVGPICESGDFLARDRMIPRSEAGDLLAVMSSGAYGYAMASNYNSRPRPAEILIAGDTSHLIAKREIYEDLIRQERIPPFLENVHR